MCHSSYLVQLRSPPISMLCLLWTGWGEKSICVVHWSVADQPALFPYLLVSKTILLSLTFHNHWNTFED